jgi:hypothetical protein
MSYSAGALGADRGVEGLLAARDHEVLLPLAVGLAVAVKENQELPLLAAIK